MNDTLIKVPSEQVPRGRGTNPFLLSVAETAAELEAEPGVWKIIGTGETDKDRSRLNNAAALLSGGRYRERALVEAYERGRFETRVSAAKNAPHADKFRVAVYARFIPNENK